MKTIILAGALVLSFASIASTSRSVAVNLGDMTATNITTAQPSYTVPFDAALREINFWGWKNYETPHLDSTLVEDWSGNHVPCNDEYHAEPTCPTSPTGGAMFAREGHSQPVGLFSPDVFTGSDLQFTEVNMVGPHYAGNAALAEHQGDGNPNYLHLPKTAASGDLSDIGHTLQVTCTWRIAGSTQDCLWDGYDITGSTTVNGIKLVLTISGIHWSQMTMRGLVTRIDQTSTVLDDAYTSGGFHEIVNAYQLATAPVSNSPTTIRISTTAAPGATTVTDLGDVQLTAALNSWSFTSNIHLAGTVTPRTITCSVTSAPFLFTAGSASGTVDKSIYFRYDCDSPLAPDEHQGEAETPGTAGLSRAYFKVASGDEGWEDGKGYTVGNGVHVYFTDSGHSDIDALNYHGGQGVIGWDVGSAEGMDHGQDAITAHLQWDHATPGVTTRPFLFVMEYH